MTSLDLLLYLFMTCVHVLPVSFASAPETATTANPLVSDTLNRYCTYRFYDRKDTESPTRVFDIRCKNDPNSAMNDDFFISDDENCFFQADNGSMSRAVEDAIQQVKTRFPSMTLQIRIHVNALHPRGRTRYVGRLMAVIDISNILAAGLSGDGYVYLRVTDAGLRVDPTFNSDRVKVMMGKGVVLVNWKYEKYPVRLW